MIVILSPAGDQIVPPFFASLFSRESRRLRNHPTQHTPITYGIIRIHEALVSSNTVTVQRYGASAGPTYTGMTVHIIAKHLIYFSIILLMGLDLVPAVSYQVFKSSIEPIPHPSPFTSVIGDYDPDHPLLTVIQPQNQPLVKNLQNPAIRAFDIQGNSTLHLKCSGNRDLVWSFPQNYIVSDAATLCHVSYPASRSSPTCRLFILPVLVSTDRRGLDRQAGGDQSFLFDVREAIADVFARRSNMHQRVGT